MTFQLIGFGKSIMKRENNSTEIGVVGGSAALQSELSDKGVLSGSISSGNLVQPLPLVWRELEMGGFSLGAVK